MVTCTATQAQLLWERSSFRHRNVTIIIKPKPEQGAVVLGSLQCPGLPFSRLFLPLPNSGGGSFLEPVSLLQSTFLPYCCFLGSENSLPNGPKFLPRPVKSIQGKCELACVCVWGGAANSYARYRKILTTNLRCSQMSGLEEKCVRAEVSCIWVSLFWHGCWKRQKVKCKPHVLSDQDISVKSRWIELTLFIVGS